MKIIIAWLFAGMIVTSAIAGGDANEWVFWKNVSNWRVDGIQKFGCRSATTYGSDDNYIVMAFSINTEGTRLWIQSQKWETVLPREIDSPVAMEIWTDNQRWPAGIAYIYQRGGLVINLNDSGVKEFQEANRIAFGFAGEYTKSLLLTSSRSAVEETARCALAMLGKDEQS
jgi:hypothetical protein